MGRGYMRVGVELWVEGEMGEAGRGMLSSGLSLPTSGHTTSSGGPGIACQAAPLHLPTPHLPTTENGQTMHSLLLLSPAGGPFHFMQICPECTHVYTHLGGSKMIEW